MYYVSKTLRNLSKPQSLDYQEALTLALLFLFFLIAGD